MINIYHSPKQFQFLEDGVKYTLREVVQLGQGGAMPLVIQFSIGYHTRGVRGILKYNENRIGILCYPKSKSVNHSHLKHWLWDVELDSILNAYVQRLFATTYIYGYVKLQLISAKRVDETAEEIELEDAVHYCLYGTSGRIDMDNELSKDIHPFLLSRGSETGALHFFRSELKAMEHIYAIIPPDWYDYVYFDTDEKEYPDQAFDDRLIFIEGRGELVAIHYSKDDSETQYDVTGANSIFLHLRVDGEPTQDRIYAIAVEDDPDTDETHLIRWTNSMGAPETLLLTGEMKDISEIEKPELYIHEQTDVRVTRKQIRGISKTKYSLHTGYLTSSRISALRDMLLSEEVEMLIEDQWVPVSVASDVANAIHQSTPEDYELTIEILEQTRYRQPNRTINPLPASRNMLLQDNSGNIILDNNSNTIQENG